MNYNKEYVYLHPTVTINKYNNSTHETIYLMAPLDNMRPDRNGQIYHINNSAFEIIETLDGTKTYDQIVSYFSIKYAEDPYEISKKILNCIKMINSCGYYLGTSESPLKHGINIHCFSNYYPTVASLEITNACNLRCRHCYGNYGEVVPKELSFNAAKKIIDHLADVNLSILEITGGDPTVNPSCSKILKYAIDAGIPKIMFLTNGACVNEDLIDMLAEYNERIYVQIDLHSLREEYYVWFTGKNVLQNVKKNICKLTQKKVKVRVCAIFTPNNVHELFDIGKWAHDNGAIFYAPSVVINIGRAENKKLCFIRQDDLLSFEKQRKDLLELYPGFIQDPKQLESNARKNCGAIRSEMSIDVDGNIRFCNMAASQKLHIEIGNVLHDSLEKIFEYQKSFLDSILDVIPPNMHDSGCAECDNKYFCNSCMLRGLLKSHEMSEKGLYCQWYDDLPTEFKAGVFF